jgi:hypothetical protein
MAYVFGGTAGLLALGVGLLLVIVIGGAALLLDARRRRGRQEPPRRASWPRPGSPSGPPPGRPPGPSSGSSSGSGSSPRPPRAAPPDRTPIDTARAQQDPETVRARLDDDAPRGARRPGALFDEKGTPPPDARRDGPGDGPGDGPPPRR